MRRYQCGRLRHLRGDTLKIVSMIEYHDTTHEHFFSLPEWSSGNWLDRMRSNGGLSERLGRDLDRL